MLLGWLPLRQGEILLYKYYHNNLEINLSQDIYLYESLNYLNHHPLLERKKGLNMESYLFDKKSKKVFIGCIHN
jgi:hypothetical protein